MFKSDCSTCLAMRASDHGIEEPHEAHELRPPEQLTECDYCEQQFDVTKRHVAALPRPSDHTELVAVLWACPECGPENNLPTAVSVMDHVEKTGSWGGRLVLFASV